MIDTHAHLSIDYKSSELKFDVDSIILAAGSVEDARNNLCLMKINKKLFPAVGIHPHGANEDIDSHLEELEKLIRDNRQKIVAIGECGLEFDDTYNQKRQEKLFRKQIEMSIKYRKPLIIHSRKANDEVLEILKQYPNTRGVIHCYTGGTKRINKVIELGEEWYFGIDGNLTYETGLENVVAEIPPHKLLLETDCPELTPEPFRGEINNPNNIRYVYKKVAEIWKKSFEETEKIIDESAKKLFNL